MDEKQSLPRPRRMLWLHWLVVIGSVGITLLAWNVSRGTLAERLSARFERESERVVSLFSEQLQRHSDILRATASQMSARGSGEHMTHEQWLDFNEALQLPSILPALAGLNVISYVRRDGLDAFTARQRKRYPGYTPHPAHDLPYLFPTLYGTTVRSPAVGLDLAHDPVRRVAIERAVMSGKTQITAPIRLTYARTTGFLMFAPYYHADEHGGVEAGNGAIGTERIAGAVLALVQADRLGAGVLDRDKRLVTVRISDAEQTLYDEIDEAHAEHDAAPLFRTSASVPLFGREWRFEIESTAAFRADAGGIEPWLILAGGLAIDALLMMIFAVLSRSAAALGEKSVALEDSNRKLASLAHAATHDLKTPLNGINALIGFIEEDLDEVAANEAVVYDIRQHVGRVQRQVRRGKNLIDGILEYSGMGSGEKLITRLDTRELIEAIGDTLLVGSERLVLEGDFPILTTCEITLSQVFTNLIGNAFKHHHDPQRATIVVGVKQASDVYRFSVSDDGPGIEPEHHERIFELFETLGGIPGPDSTGVGLSIVKKAIEGMGGSISLTSAPGQGTTFCFDWPVEVIREGDTPPAAGEDDAEVDVLSKAA